MKKNLFLIIVFTILSSYCIYAINQKADSTQLLNIDQKNKKKSDKKNIIKTGWNFGPLPVVAFDADKGLQLGALLNMFDFKDGSNYPNYMQKWYFEASFFMKGSQFFTINYDNKFSIPGIRFCAAATFINDNALDFYGFNGYQSFYDYERIKIGKSDPTQPQYTPFYRMSTSTLFIKADFIGNIIGDKFKWEAGYHFNWIRKGNSNLDKINKGKSEEKKYPAEYSSLYQKYLDWGIISDKEAKGGINSTLRLGLIYDSRNREGAPSKGIWAEGHLILAPKFLGTTNPYYRYSFTFRHYVPIVKNDVLTFAYRLNYQGTIGKSAPFYVLPLYTIVGEGNDRDGIGGYRTVRGIFRNKVQGLDVAFYNAEIRYRFVKFVLWKQNIALALNAFSDGAMTIRGYDMSFKGDKIHLAEYNEYMAKGKGKDLPHITAGGGFRFIMNENFIVAVEYGMPLGQLRKQDGNGSLYINIGYLF